MNTLAIPLPPALLRRAQFVGIAVGIGSFPVSLWAGSLLSFLPTGASAVVMPIVLSAAIAGWIATFAALASSSPEAGIASLRLGARAGFVGSLVAGSLSVLAFSLHMLGIGEPFRMAAGSDDLLLSLLSPTARAIVLPILAIPPSVFFALAGSLLAAMLFRKPSAPDVSAKASKKPSRSIDPYCIAFLTAAGYFSPGLLLLQSEPVQQPLSVAAAQPVEASAPISPSPAPVLQYSISQPITISPSAQPASYQAPVAPNAELKPSDPTLRVRIFVVQHHAKASSANIEGFVSDYGDPVRYMSHGVVRRDFVRADFKSYHSPGTRVSETVISPPTAVLTPEDILSNYSISFSRVTPDGKATTGIGDFSLHIADTAQGLKIIEQHIKIRQ